MNDDDDSRSKSKSRELWDGAGETGKVMAGSRNVGDAADSAGCWLDGAACAGVDVCGEMGCADCEAGGAVLVDRPCAASAFMTASQPFSRVRMRSRSSSFSRSFALSRFCSSAFGSELEGAATRPARSWRFSSSSSLTRRSRKTYWALRRSREFWAAIRLRCARASLRSSEEAAVRWRLRDGPGSESGVSEEGGMEMDDGSTDIAGVEVRVDDEKRE